MYQVSTLAEALSGSVVHREQQIVDKIFGFAPLNTAQQGQLSFYGNKKYFNDFATTQASLVIVQSLEEIPDTFTGSVLLVPDVYTAVSQLYQMLDQKREIEPGIHSSARVHSETTIADTASIGQLSVVKSGVVIGGGSHIMDQVYLGENVKIGKNCVIYPGVRILDHCAIGDHCIIQSNTVVGSDGFGYAPSPSGEMVKIPQLGKVIIEERVEIGSNCAIDRGSLKDTIIRAGVKLDNLIQVAHNVEIGSDTVIAAQTGIAGSTTLGKGCMVGGQVGIVGHLDIADGTKIQAQSGMIKSVKQPNTAWYGYPAIDYSNYMRSFAAFKNLPDLLKRVKELEKQIKDKDE